MAGAETAEEQLPNDMGKNKNKNIERTFPVLGMSCAACAARMDKTLNGQPGVREASINYAAATARVEFDPDVCSEESLKAAAQHAGYDLLIDTGEDSEEEAERIRAKRYESLKKRTFWAIALSVPIAVFSMAFMEVPGVKYAVWVLSTPVVFGLGSGFFVHAWKQLRHGSANMDTLVAVSTGIAYLFSVFNLFFPEFWRSKGIEPHVYFEAGSVIVAFILLGRLLEERAKKQTSSAIRKLAGLQPKTVCVLTESGEERIVPVTEIRSGDTVAVKPGERVAADGTVISGGSYVDESMLTGEPVPVYKKSGEKVFAGTINQKGAFRFRADKIGTDTLLSQIVRMVRDAQGSKAPVQKLADRVAGVFVPVILLLSVLTFAAWWIFAPENGFTYGLLAMVTVLIIACPCALGLATPTAVMVGIGKGAEQGILIKDAEGLEIARKIDAVVLDKTGTVTQGHPAVAGMVWEPGSEGERSVLYGLEKLSEHPLSEAVVRALSGETPAPVSDFENMAGRGIRGTAEGRTYYAGNSELLAACGVTPGGLLREQAGRWMEEAKTVVWFFDAEKVIAAIAVTDEVRETSASAVARLHEMGIEIYMLTGDHAASAERIAGEVGITRYRSGVLPQEKASFVRRLQAEGKTVAMVGDGINDSAALAQADLSIAMGRGSDIAMDAAMVTVLSSDLLKIPEMIRLSQLTVRTIRQNLFWAFVYNMIGVPIAAGVLFPINGFLLNPMIGGAAMAFSSVSVVANSLRLRRRRIDGTSRFSRRKAASSATMHRKTEYQRKHMKKTWKVEGMMCDHCRAHVEKALNGIPGVKAVVTLHPPVAVVEFSEREIELAVLQKVVSEQAGDYRLSETE